MIPNPHPPLTGFPVVLLFLIIVAELLSVFRKEEKYQLTANFALILVILITPLTYLTGYLAGDSFDFEQDSIRNAISTHQLWALISMLLLAVTGLIKYVESIATHAKHIFKRTYFILLIACFSLFLYASFLGGELVFHFGVGVSNN